MDEEKKQFEIEIDAEKDDNLEKLEETVLGNNDELNVNISTEDVDSLTESEAAIIGQKIEVLIDKYEDILIKAEKDNLSEEEVIALGFNEDDYYRLKNLDKLIYSHIRKSRKKTKENGFFASIPTWAFILFIVCAVFTIVPVNPYLPINVYINLMGSFQTSFMQGVGGTYVFYFCYIGIFFITEIVSLIILFIKGKKEKEKNASFKSCLILFIINVLINIPSLILFINVASGYNA